MTYLHFRILFLSMALSLVACASPAPPGDAGADARGDVATDNGLVGDVVIPDRNPGERTPMSAACDPVDPSRCLLPWPSNVFTVRDPATPTGLRLAVQPRSLPGTQSDDPTPLDRADGFSRVSPLLTILPGDIDPSSLGEGTSGALRLLVAQPGASEGELVPLRFHTVRGTSPSGTETLVLAYPLRPLAANSDHVVVVLDQARRRDGSTLPPTPEAQAALGLRTPANLIELTLRAYHAPTRALLARVGIDPARVVRVWDFTTRSADDPRRALRAIRDATVSAVDMARATVAIDTVTLPSDATSPVALVVEGRLQGLPNFVSATGGLDYDASGAPQSMGSHDAPFRIAIPRGTGNYRVLIYGHGMGGNVHDDAFDVDITQVGAAKVGIEFAGLTDRTLDESFASLVHVFGGTDRLVARLVQSLADGMAIQRALRTVLGDALAAPMLGGSVNPAVGRRPQLDRTLWVGGSLGGTMGLVYSSLETDVVAGVLNVPGAAWTHFLPYSNLFNIAALVLRANYRTDIDIAIAVGLSQSLWDLADGASYADLATTRGVPLLEQESIGDPVLPNPGSDMVAVATEALHIGAVLAPVTGLGTADEAIGRSGFTQYRVPNKGIYAVHGFAARDTPGGRAAREQIFDFVRSVWAGTPRITVPAECRTNTPPGSCDFSGGM